MLSALLTALSVFAFVPPTSVAPPPSPLFAVQAQLDEASFEKAYADVQALMARRRWKQAYDSFQELLAAHGDRPYVIARLAEIEPDLKRCAFWRDHDEPELGDLLAADVRKWDPYTGRVRLIFEESTLGDLTKHKSLNGAIYEVPIVWDKTWNATFEGTAKSLQGKQFVVLLSPEESYAFTIGHKSKKSFLYYKHVGVHVRNGKSESLGEIEPEEMPEDKSTKARLTVSASQIKLTVGRKTVFTVRRKDEAGLGRLAFSPGGVTSTGEFGQLEVEGQAQTGWFDGLVDAAVQGARDTFEAGWDPADHMPEALARTAAEISSVKLPSLGLFPVPETFDLNAPVHARTEEHVSAVERHLGRGRPNDALRYLNGLGAGDIEASVHAFLGCISLYVAGRPAEAFTVGQKLWDDQPESMTAVYLQAMLHASLDRFVEAERAFRDLTERFPEAWEPWYGLASVRLMTRRPTEAFDALERGKATAARPAYLHRLESRLALLKRGPAWDRVHEQEALHFRVTSDTDARTTRTVSREAESAWKTYEKLLGPAALPAGETIPLFLFSGEASYRAYAFDALDADMHHTAGMFSRALQVILVWNSNSEEALYKTIRHEVLHQYLDVRFGDMPTWFNEGMAEYHEIMDFGRGLPILGEVHPEHAASGALSARALRKLDLESFVSLSPADFYASAESAYPTAWAFIHFLKHSTPERNERLDNLWSRLESGSDGRSAVDDAFRNVDWSAWNTAFREHVASLLQEER